MRIGDDRLAGLAGFGKLRHLKLEGPVAADGLARLAELGFLWNLSLQDAKVSDEGVAALARAVPDRQILR